MIEFKSSHFERDVILWASALGIHGAAAAPPAVGAFSDPPFDDFDIYLAKFEIGRQI